MPKITDTPTSVDKLSAIAESFRELAAQIEGQIANMKARNLDEVVVQNWSTTSRAIKDCQRFAGILATALVDAKLGIQSTPDLVDDEAARHQTKSEKPRKPSNLKRKP